MKVNRTSKLFFNLKASVIFIFAFSIITPVFSQSPWPGETWQNSVNLTSLATEFQTNLSGASWNLYTRRLWVCVNGPGTFFALKEDGKGSFKIDSAGGKLAKWSYNGDLESICQASYRDKTVFLIDEGTGTILEFNVATGTQTSLLHSWNISANIPVYTGGSGPEGITFVPDYWLNYSGFTDKNGLPYTSKNDMGGLMFIAHQNGGHIYAFDLNRQSNTYMFVGEYATSRSESSGLEFDRSTGKLYIWHNTGSNYFEVTDLSSAVNNNIRKFITQKEFYGPKGGNVEGIALTPASTNENWYFATDDSNQDGYALMWFRNFKPCLPEPFFTTDKISICEGDTIVFQDTTIGKCGTETYVWKFGEGANPSIVNGVGPHKVVYNSAGEKDITMIIKGNVNDSIKKTSYITVNSLPDLPVIHQNIDTLYTDIYKSYQWYFNDSILTGDTNRIYLISKVGGYKVKVDNESGCSSLSAQYLITDNLVKDIGKDILKDIKIYSDYAGRLSINYNSNEQSKAMINILSSSGVCVKSLMVENMQKNTIIDVENLENGFYIIQVNTQQFTLARKFVLINP